MESYEFVLKLSRYEKMVLYVKNLFMRLSMQILYLVLSAVLTLVLSQIWDIASIPYLVLLFAGCYLFLFIVAIVSVLIKATASQKQFHSVIVYQKSEISREGYIEYTQNGVNKIRWEEFKKVRSGRMAYYLYLKNTSRYIAIPKRLLADPACELMEAVVAEDGKRARTGQSDFEGIPGNVNTRITMKDGVTFGIRSIYLHNKLFPIVMILLLAETVFLLWMDPKVGAILACFFVFLNLVLLISILIRCRLAYKVPEVVSYRFDEDAFYKTNRFGESRFEWSKIHKVIVSKKYLYLYVMRQAAFIIPKVTIPPETLSALQSILLRNRRIRRPML